MVNKTWMDATLTFSQHANDPSQTVVAGPRNVVLPAIASALFGSHATELGRSIILAWDVLWLGKEPKEVQEVYVVQAGLLVLGVGFLVLLALGSRKAIKTGKAEDHDALVVSIVVGLIGGAFSILGKVFDKSGTLQPQIVAGFFYLFVVACIFIPPLWVLPWHKSENKHSSKLVLVMTVAGLVALLPTAFLMLVYTWLAAYCDANNCLSTSVEGHFQLGTTSFFFVAPVAATLYAPWVLLTVDPILRGGRWPKRSKSWRYRWFFGYLLLGTLLGVFYALTNYFPDHGVDDNGWMHAASFDRLQAILFILGLQMPPLLCGIGTVLYLKPKHGEPLVRPADLLPYFFSALACALIAGLIGSFLVGKAGMTTDEIVLFVAAHSATAGATSFAVVAAYRLRRKSKV